MDNDTLKWAAQWIEGSLKGETDERVIEFGRNMAMTLRAASDPITQPTASASAPTQTVPDESSVQHETECLACDALRSGTFAVTKHTHQPESSSPPPDARVVVNEIEATVGEIFIRQDARKALHRAQQPFDLQTVLWDVDRLLSIIDSLKAENVDCVCGHNGNAHREEEGTGAARECNKCDCAQFSNVHMALKFAASNIKAELVERVREKAVTARGYVSDVGFALDQLATELEAVQLDQNQESVR